MVGLYRLFTNFLKFPGESPGLGRSIGGRGGGVLGITGPSPSYPSFFTLLTSLRGERGGGGGRNYTETGKKHLITLSAHNFFYNCSVKIILCSSCSLIMCFTNDIKS